MNTKTGYSVYNPKAKSKIKVNPLEDLYPTLPNKKYDVIYADPPWDYGGKMQYDKSSIKSENIDSVLYIIKRLWITSSLINNGA